MRQSAAIALLASLLSGGSVVAQEGHPLVGSWHGDRGSSAGTRTDVTVLMDWDGSRITGIVNPGFDAMPLQAAKLNPKDWTVHFEVDSKEGGTAVRCIVDGKLDRLGSDQRTLSGTWVCGSVKQNFTLKRARDYSR